MDSLSHIPLDIEWWGSWWAGLSLLCLGLWLVQRHVPNAGLADLGFCLGFGLVMIGCALHVEGTAAYRALIAGMGTLYAGRLAYHLWINRIAGKPEDARYHTLRLTYGKRAQTLFFFYFQGQTYAVLFFAFPLCLLMAHPTPSLLSPGTILGVLIWITAIIGETVADYQLQQFRANPTHRGRTLRQGLWRYSRHPNYFFEGLHWCAYVPMGLGAPFGWLTILCPLVMVTALLKVTGIPFAEAQALAGRGEDYRDYQRTTSAFFPWFPRTSTEKQEPT